MNGDKRFYALDSFRGICALSVVVFHMHLIGSITKLDFFRGSSIIVEFFFVLSGFVLAHGYAYKNDLKFATFMKSRFFRLYPLHLFMFAVMLALEVCKLLAYKFGGFVFNFLPFTKLFSIQEIIPNLLLIQSWTSYADSLSFNYPSWSISVEFYMYALFFGSIVVCRNNKVMAWMTASLAAFMLIYFQSSILKLEVLRGISCFFGGAFTYWVFTQTATKFKLNHTIGTCIEVLLLSMIVFVVQSKFDHQSLVASALFMVTVFIFAFEFGSISKLLHAKFFQMIGKLSYSIYMTHAAILFCLTSIAIIIQKATGMPFAPMVDGHRNLDFGNPIINNMVVLIIITLVIAISGITYKYIELSGQKLNKRSKETANTYKDNAKQKEPINEV